MTTSLPRHAALSAIILALGVSAMQAQAGPPMYKPDSSPPRRIAMPAVVEVPLLHPNARDSRAQVEVMVNGRGPYRFDVETGARQIGLSSALATALALHRIGGTDSEPEFHVDSIRVGEALFQDMPVALLPNGVDGIDGVLGLPFYQNLLLTIDYPGMRLRFSRDTLPSPDGREILSLIRIDDFWGIPITLGGKPFHAVLDTQNGGGLHIPPVVADALTFADGLQVLGRARGAFGVTEVKGGQLTGDLRVGRYIISQPFLEVIQLPPDYPNQPNAGTHLLDNFVVSLDQVHGRLRLARSDTSAVHLPGPKRGPGRGGQQIK